MLIFILLSCVLIVNVNVGILYILCNSMERTAYIELYHYETITVSNSFFLHHQHPHIEHNGKYPRKPPKIATQRCCVYARRMRSKYCAQ